MIKKYIFMALGFISLAIAYIGFVTPGIPFSIFLVFSAYCFAKSNKKMERWLYNHPWFGKFLTNWTQKKVFPLKGKYAMVAVMSSTLVFTWYFTGNMKAVLWSGIFMALVAVWAWRFPSTVEEHQARVKAGKKIGWLK